MLGVLGGGVGGWMREQQPVALCIFLVASVCTTALIPRLSPPTHLPVRRGEQEELVRFFQSNYDDLAGRAGQSWFFQSSYDDLAG